MTAVYALYDDPDAAQQAVDRLRTAGASDREITVISAEPMDDYEFSRIGGSNALWWVACLGGLVGMAFGVWLPRYTQSAWPLTTGNMPLMPWWTNLIIVFELTMLGVLVATVGTLILTAGLCRRRAALYDPEVSRGKILVGVENPTRGVPDVVRALTIGGAEPRLVALD